VKLYFLSEINQAEEYCKILENLIDNKISLKEPIHLAWKETLYVGKKQKPMYDQPHAPFSVDTWLDLTNNLIFARNPQTLTNLLITIPNSVKFMDSQK
jgi:hypothetical protein